ncbi:MAG: DUF2520 domain-containing protein [Syntrophobacterales bacterium CG_4_8_14_3_um_filter_49_14]|nr:MAG: DUF2520 domain-containing protein [Syntrophobacterales bacterium CG_4_8_14_3_um_filter_49_14]
MLAISRNMKSASQSAVNREPDNLSSYTFFKKGYRLMIESKTTRETGRDSIAIIGLGKVGTAVGFLLRSAGYKIVAVAGRSTSSIEQALPYTGGKAFSSLSEAASQAECILVTTGDDAIAPVCEEMVKGGGVKHNSKVVHMSGAGGLDLLDAARRAGAHVASIHPLQTFADVKGAIESIPGSTFGITADDEIKDWSVKIVRDLGGIPFFVPEADKPLYHAAACMASNYLVTMMHTVEGIYTSLGLTGEEAIHAFWPLVSGTIKNIETKGTILSLTGPISRGDVGTIKKHLQAFREKLPAFLPAYCAMGVLTTDLGLKKKTLSADRAGIIKKLLGGGREDEQAGKNR